MLASDGYPFLKNTLAESEQILAKILQDDPLLLRQYKAAKGLKKSSISFDDRAYLKLYVERER